MLHSFLSACDHIVEQMVCLPAYNIYDAASFLCLNTQLRALNRQASKSLNIWFQTKKVFFFIPSVTIVRDIGAEYVLTVV